MASSQPSGPTATLQAGRNVRHERKFNVVPYGMCECPSCTPISTRLEEDLTKVISEVDQSINSHSIKDIYQLGKYSPDNRKPRPLLVKFIRIADATSILSKRRSPHSTPVFIKPDMSPTERRCESILLKERWSLIQSGVPREVIKIRLLVRNKLHGRVTKSAGSDLSFSCHNSVSAENNNRVSCVLPIVITPSHTTTAVPIPNCHFSIGPE